MRDARATVTGSILSQNTVSAPGGTARGGGIFGEGTTMTVARSTVTGKTVTGAIAEGGGLYNVSTDTGPGTATLTDSNVTKTLPAAPPLPCAGIFNANPTSSSVTLNRTSVSGNVPDNCAPPIGRCT
jgi:hypothetical protein